MANHTVTWKKETNLSFLPPKICFSVLFNVLRYRNLPIRPQPMQVTNRPQAESADDSVWHRTSPRQKKIYALLCFGLDCSGVKKKKKTVKNLTSNTSSGNKLLVRVNNNPTTPTLFNSILADFNLLRYSTHHRFLNSFM